jgi:hypothetical protein
MNLRCNVVRNEKSPAADNFHPGFSPESSLMLLSLAGLLARAASSDLPIPNWNSGAKWRMFGSAYEPGTYSYGNSTGFTPVSLLMARCGANQSRPQM